MKKGGQLHRAACETCSGWYTESGHGLLCFPGGMSLWVGGWVRSSRVPTKQWPASQTRLQPLVAVLCAGDVRTFGAHHRPDQ